jgi:hypothetical protein
MVTPIERVPGSAAGADARHLVRADHAGELEPRQIDDRQHLLLGADLLARQRMALGHDAGDGRHQVGIAQADARGVERGLGRGQVGARGVECRARAVECAAADELLRRQALVAGVRALGLGQRRAGRLQQGVALGDPAAQLGELDAADGLAGRHAAAFGHVQRQQRAPGLGAHDGRLRGHQRARELEHRRHAGGERLHHLARGELQRHLGLAVLAVLAFLARPGRLRRATALPGQLDDTAHHHRGTDTGQHQHGHAGHPLLLHRVPLGCVPARAPCARVGWPALALSVGLGPMEREAGCDEAPKAGDEVRRPLTARGPPPPRSRAGRPK